MCCRLLCSMDKNYSSSCKRDKSPEEREQGERYAISRVRGTLRPLPRGHHTMAAPCGGGRPAGRRATAILLRLAACCQGELFVLPAEQSQAWSCSVDHFMALVKAVLVSSFLSKPSTIKASGCLSLCSHWDVFLSPAFGLVWCICSLCLNTESRASFSGDGLPYI